MTENTPYLCCALDQKAAIFSLEILELSPGKTGLPGPGVGQEALATLDKEVEGCRKSGGLEL